MSAGCGRAMKPGGRIPRGSLRRSMDGLCLLAARFSSGLLTAREPSCPPRVAVSNVCGVIRSGPNSGPLPGWRVENGCAGQVCFVETVTTQQHRARPGRPAPSPTRRGSRRRRVVGDGWLVAGGWPPPGPRRRPHLSSAESEGGNHQSPITSHLPLAPEGEDKPPPPR